MRGLAGKEGAMRVRFGSAHRACVFPCGVQISTSILAAAPRATRAVHATDARMPHVLVELACRPCGLNSHTACACLIPHCARIGITLCARVSDSAHKACVVDFTRRAQVFEFAVEPAAGPPAARTRQTSESQHRPSKGSQLRKKDIL
eukprot:363257-Chlamydomonas_euryale.AAC.19